MTVARGGHGWQLRLADGTTLDLTSTLDVSALEAMEQAQRKYPGTLIAVTGPRQASSVA